MMSLAQSVVEQYGFSVFGKDQNGEWKLVCAVDSQARADFIADAIVVANGMETKVEATA